MRLRGRGRKTPTDRQRQTTHTHGHTLKGGEKRLKFNPNPNAETKPVTPRFNLYFMLYIRGAIVSESTSENVHKNTFP
jgi:hypothetical protein